jgi:transposase
MTTKIIAVVDGLGSLIRFTLTPGQQAEITQARMLIEGLPFGALLADKAYDADHFRSFLNSSGVEAVIPARKRRRHPAAHDAAKYKWRHGIENFFQKLKEFKRIAMRACKTGQSFEAMICLAATFLRTR